MPPWCCGTRAGLGAGEGGRSAPCGIGCIPHVWRVSRAGCTEGFKNVSISKHSQTVQTVHQFALPVAVLILLSPPGVASPLAAPSLLCSSKMGPGPSTRPI
jgi:hypothetical protein